MDTDCCVCLETKHNLVKYDCGHKIVCIQCDMSWKGPCPVCRGDKSKRDNIPHVRERDGMWRITKLYNSLANNRINSCAVCMGLTGKRALTGCCRFGICPSCIKEEAIAFATGFTGSKPICYCCGTKKWKIIKESGEEFRTLFLSTLRDVSPDKIPRFFRGNCYL